MRAIVGAVVLAGMIASVAMCATRQAGTSGTDACVSKGESYFRSVGSWPTLSDGRNAASVARERCERSPMAFG